MKESGVVNIYNLQQCYFYIRNGLDPIYVGANEYKNNKIFMKFRMDDSKELYKKWCISNKNECTENSTYKNK